MTSIGYDNIEDVMVSILDPNTGGKTYEVPGISTTKIDGATSVYNVSGSDGIAGWSTDIGWSSTDYNTVAWTSGGLYLPDGTGISVTSGNTGNMSATTYIYYDQSTASMQTTTTAQDAVGEGKILMCVASPTQSGKDAQFQAFGTNAQSTFITADNIAANTIAANDLVGNTISGRTIEGCTIRAYYGSGASLDEIKMWTDGSLPKIQITDNGTVVGSINGAALTVGGTSREVLAIGGSNKYIGLVGKVVVSGYLRIPVGSNLYFN